MSTYTIGEAAARSGFSASSLRYYEGIGLVSPAGRSEGGYRLYDEQDLARLAFIARAKQLGCSLEEISDLVAIWDGERCGPVQRRFHELVTAKLVEARRQASEIETLTAELEGVAVRLAGPAVDGPCGDGCACLVGSGSGLSPGQPVTLVGRPSPEVVPCTLGPGELDERLDDWRRLLAQARSRRRVDGGVRVELPADVDLGELGRLVGAEQSCCAFFTFTVSVDRHGVALEVRAPADAQDMVHALVGDAT